MGICTSKKELLEDQGSSLVEGNRRASYLAKETSSKESDAPFPKEQIGFHSNHGIKPAGFGSTAKINQDRGVIQYPLADDKQQMLLAVYDGHGQHGEHCSEFAAFECIQLLETDANTLAADPKKALFKQIVEADSRMRKKRDVPSYESGTTAIVCVMRPDRIWAACVGDSRAVMARETSAGGRWVAIDLSVDQKPDTPAERERIVKAGGFVSDASDMYGPARVWKGAYGIGPGLAMARSMGDHAVAEFGVFAEPEITETQITPADRCVVLASDGVWEFIESQEAIDIVYKHRKDATAASKALIAEAGARWKREEGNYRDDVSAMELAPAAYTGGAMPESSAVLEQLAGSAGAASQKAEFDGDLEEQVAAEEEAAAAESAAAMSDGAAAGDALKPTFARRRLSVANVPGDEGKAK